MPSRVMPSGPRNAFIIVRMPSIFMYASRSSRPPGAMSTRRVDELGVVEREADGHGPAVGVADDRALLDAERRE